MDFQNYTGMKFNGSKNPKPPFDEVTVITFLICVFIGIIVLLQHI